MINMKNAIVGATKFELNMATLINIVNSWLEENFAHSENIELTSFYWNQSKNMFEISFRVKEKP